MAKNVTLFNEPLSQVDINIFTLWNVGLVSVAPLFRSDPMISFIPKIHSFLSSQPNASDSSLASFLGSSPSDARLLRNKFMIDLDTSLENVVSEMVRVMDNVPHFQNFNFVPIAGVMIVLTAIFVGLRFFSRSRVVTAEKVMAHDWVMLAAWVSTVAWEITAITQSRIPNIFEQVYDLSYPNFGTGQAFSFTLLVTYPIPLMLIKTSILLLYKSIFPRHTSKVFHFAVYLTFGLALISTICQSLGVLLSCKPINVWDHILTANCPIDWQLLARYTTVVNIISDFMILLIPIPIVWALMMSIQERLLVTLTFALGSLSCIASVIRLYFLINNQTLGTDHCFAMNLCALIELNVAIMCSCVPAMRLLIERYWPKLLGSTPVKNKRVSRILAIAGHPDRNSESVSINKRFNSRQMGRGQLSVEKQGNTEAVV